MKKTLPTDTIVGQNLRRLRMMRGLTQMQLAEACDITFQQVQKYEKGTNRISASRLVQMANALSVPVTDLFQGCEGAMVQALALPTISASAMRAAERIDALPTDKRTAFFNILAALVEPLTIEATPNREAA